MLLKQHHLGCLARASYLIAAAETGTAIVVDPQRHSERYLHDARQRGWHINRVFLTYFHANFLTVPHNRTVALQGAGGYRPAIAASIPAHQKITTIANVQPAAL